MESPAPTPASQNLRRSSMFHFFHSLVGSKGSSKSSDKAMLEDQQCPMRELAAVSLMTKGQEGVGRKDPSLQASVPHTLSVALPQHSPSGLGMEVGVLSITAPGVEVKSVLPRGSLEVLGNLSEKKERKEEEEEAAGEASGETGTSDRAHFSQALEVKQRDIGPLEVSPEVFTREEEKERLLDGFMESELKKLLVVQQESRLWKMGGHKGREPLIHPEISLEESGIVDGQGQQADGEGSHPPAFGECWGPGREAPRQLKPHPRLERRVQSPPGVVYSTEHLLLEEMDEMGNWPPE